MSEFSGISRRRAAARDERTAVARVFQSTGLLGASLGDIAAEADADRASL